MAASISVRTAAILFISLLVAVFASTYCPESVKSKMGVLSDILSYVTKRFFVSTPATKMASTQRTPVYFLSHGGPNVQYNTKHPVYPVLQQIGKEITEKVKPKAVIVFSAHWQARQGTIHINNAEQTDLIYDFGGFPKHYYEATYPNKGSPALASQVQSLLSAAGIKSVGVKRGLDHGVWSGFNVAFDPKRNPLGVPLVQVSLFNSEDPDAHHALGRAVAPLRDEGVVIIGAGMSVHNLNDFRLALRSSDPEIGARPMPYTVSFDEALKEAAEEPDLKVRQDRLREILRRPDARQAHPTMDHLMPIHVAAGAAGEDRGKRIWTMPEGSLAWAQYRFGEVPNANETLLGE